MGYFMTHTTKEDRIQLALQDAISAQFLFNKKKSKVDKLSNIILILTMLVPVSILVALYWTKNTPYQFIADIVASIISAILFGLSLLALILKLEDKKLNYTIGYQNNRKIIDEARSLQDDATPVELKYFFDYVAYIDNHDNNLLGTIPKKLEQEAYREVLKKADLKGETCCPHCKQFPRQYKKWRFLGTLCTTCGILIIKGNN